ncbi:MAG TPA: SEC-C metal-binding domain-containing protein [Vicinamibacterales bacterium]|nr:SEC-C metal-binding domain-containing protein [Vicinamibacterales bacterium]
MSRPAARPIRASRVSRNESCPCGSGRKYKYCCERKTTSMSTGGRVLLAVVIAVALVGVVLAFTSRTEPGARPGQVWSPEHGHYHLP